MAAVRAEAGSVAAEVEVHWVQRKGCNRVWTRKDRLTRVLEETSPIAL